jgi:hypothetical protein
MAQSCGEGTLFKVQVEILIAGSMLLFSRFSVVLGHQAARVQQN